MDINNSNLILLNLNFSKKMSSIKKPIKATLTEVLIKDLKNGRVITDQEYRTKNTEKEMWVLIYNKIFDLTNFYMEHPGGWDVIE